MIEFDILMSHASSNFYTLSYLKVKNLKLSNNIFLIYSHIFYYYKKLSVESKNLSVWIWISICENNKINFFTVILNNGKASCM